MNLVGNSTYNEHERCIIKEELIISDESENELWNNIPNCTSDVDKKMSLRPKNNKRVSSKQQDQDCNKRQSETAENKLLDNFEISTSHVDKKISVMPENNKRVSSEQQDDDCKRPSKVSEKLLDNIETSTSDVDKKTSLRLENIKRVSSKQQDEDCKRQSKALENELLDNIETSSSDVDKKMSLRPENNKRVSSKQQDEDCNKQQNETAENKLLDNFETSASDGGKKISVKSKYEGRDYSKNRDKRDKRASAKYIKNHVKSYCPECDEKRSVIIRKPKCFTCRTYLRYHCEKCMTSYAQYRILRYHIREKHLNGPTYKCKQCDKLFTLLKYKNRHEKVCGMPPEMSCNFCPYKSSYQSNINRHIKYKHPDK